MCVRGDKGVLERGTKRETRERERERERESSLLKKEKKGKKGRKIEEE